MICHDKLNIHDRCRAVFTIQSTNAQLYAHQSTTHVTLTSIPDVAMTPLALGHVLHLLVDGSLAPSEWSAPVETITIYDWYSAVFTIQTTNSITCTQIKALRVISTFIHTRCGNNSTSTACHGGWLACCSRERCIYKIYKNDGNKTSSFMYNYTYMYDRHTSHAPLPPSPALVPLPICSHTMFTLISEDILPET